MQSTHYVLHSLTSLCAQTFAEWRKAVLTSGQPKGKRMLNLKGIILKKKINPHRIPTLSHLKAGNSLIPLVSFFQSPTGQNHYHYEQSITLHLVVKRLFNISKAGKMQRRSRSSLGLALEVLWLENWLGHIEYVSTYVTMENWTIISRIVCCVYVNRNIKKYIKREKESDAHK